MSFPFLPISFGVILFKKALLFVCDRSVAESDWMYLIALAIEEFILSIDTFFLLPVSWDGVPVYWFARSSDVIPVGLVFLSTVLYYSRLCFFTLNLCLEELPGPDGRSPLFPSYRVYSIAMRVTSLHKCFVTFHRGHFRDYLQHQGLPSFLRDMRHVTASQLCQNIGEKR